jgi:predicted GNAT family acetyltransferase
VTIVRPADGRAYLAIADPLLAADEARHNLTYGIAGVVARDPQRFPGARFWVVTRDGEPVAAAMRTPPRNVILADAVDGAAVIELAAAIHGDDPAIPGVVGNEPFVDRFVQAWTASTGLAARLTMAQGVFRLDRVAPVQAAPGGTARPAKTDEVALAIEWWTAFAEEAIPEEAEHPDDPRLRETIEGRIAAEDSSGLWFWESDGRPVAMTGHSGPTPNGIRVGPVYTPQANRRMGYATALVAAQSAWLLAQGRQFCFLYTDLANPTSNAIYERIGYQRVADAASYIFE